MSSSPRPTWSNPVSRGTSLPEKPSPSKRAECCGRRPSVMRFTGSLIRPEITLSLWLTRFPARRGWRIGGRGCSPVEACSTAAAIASLASICSAPATVRPGPASIDPLTGRAYGPNFPLVTVHDIVTLQARLLEKLNIQRLKLVMGASIGGMQALQLAIEFPQLMNRVISIGAAPLGAMGLGLNHLQRQMIQLDPAWQRWAL